MVVLCVKMMKVNQICAQMVLANSLHLQFIFESWQTNLVMVYIWAYLELCSVLLILSTNCWSSLFCILQVPSLHQDGVNNIFFSWSRILSWMLNGLCCSIIIFFGALNAVLIQAVRQDGRVAGFDILGVTMYTCVVWTVNCQLALYISYFTWIQHFVIWGSILIWYTFLIIYGSFPAVISTTAYHVFWEACASSPLYWLSTLVIVVTALLPFFLYKITCSLFYPQDHERVQRTNSKGWWWKASEVTLWRQRLSI
jgi:phospholipid-translocating ATPase